MHYGSEHSDPFIDNEASGKFVPGLRPMLQAALPFTTSASLQSSLGFGDSHGLSLGVAHGIQS